MELQQQTFFFLSACESRMNSTPLVGNQGADFTHPITAAAATLPGFRGRTTLNPVDTEHRNTRRKKQSKSETTCTDN